MSPYNVSKFAELILYIKEKYQSDLQFGAGKLNMILFIVDCLAYRKFGSSITGVEYKKQSNAAKPLEQFPWRKLINIQQVAPEATHTKYDGQVNLKTAYPKKAELSVFSKEEISLIDDTLGKMQNEAVEPESEIGRVMARLSLVKEGEIISYIEVTK